MSLRHQLGKVLLPALLLAATGCHKHRKQAYRQPPPPDTTSDNSTAGRSSHGHHGAPPPSSSGTARSLPVQPEIHGKPFATQTGLASWYGPPYAGRKGADGKVYDQNAMTAAHLTLPLGTLVRVTNLANGESVVVRITDRGPFVHGRIIDLSLAAAKATGVYRAGVAKVKVEAYTAPRTARSNSPGNSPSNAPSTSAIPGGHWCVQIGAFYNPRDAIQLKNDLLRRYTTAKVIEFAGPTGHWVRINPKVPDKKNADQIAAAIHVPDAEPYVIRTD